MALFIYIQFWDFYNVVMNLKQLRKSKGLSQLEASKIVSIPLRTYKRYETDSNYVGSFKYQTIYAQIKNTNKSNHKNSSVKSLRITVAGIGYVGLSLGTLLSLKHNVVITDINESKIDQVNKRIPPLMDKELDEYFQNKKLNLTAKYSDKDAYKDSDIIIIAVPTDFNPETKTFDTSKVNEIVSLVNEANQKALVVIKSTVPIGYTKQLNQKYPKMSIVFSPEFLREGSAVKDNLYPSRIIVGCDKITQKNTQFGRILEEIALNLNKTIYMSSSEAEAVKLFSNAYLAMRVAYFNELDTYAKEMGLDCSNIIEGVSRDARIGDFYNNPSFGYGGYCLPKDSEQLQSSFIGITNSNLIRAIVDSNQTRKDYIANGIIKEAIQRSGKNVNQITIGIYSLAMKSGSDNHRSSSSVDVMNILKDKGVRVIVYDKTYKDSEKDIDSFKKKSDLIVANRYSSLLNDVKEKLYTRDIYTRD